MRILRHHVSGRRRLSDEVSGVRSERLASSLGRDCVFLFGDGIAKGSRVQGQSFNGGTHSVEINDYGPVCFHHCRFASQRYDFTEDADGAVGEGIEILGVNTRGSFGGHGWTVFGWA